MTITMEAEVIVDRETQHKRIMGYLKEKGTITVREAFLLGINSPTKRFSELIGKGLMKVKEDVKVMYMNKYGRMVQKTHYVVYEEAA